MTIRSARNNFTIFSPNDLECYLEKDPLLERMNCKAQDKDISFVSHQWLLDSPAKRMIFEHVYGDLLKSGENLSILDVGGGYSSLSRIMLEHHDYHLLDIMAHDSEDDIRNIEKSINKDFWINQDWYMFNILWAYDCVIANDIFPNVDQRIELFLEKYLPYCKEIRMTLTFYNQPRFYPTKRIDGDEVLYFLAWSGNQLEHVLKKYITDENLERLSLSTESLFPNKRIVAFLRLPGNA